MKDNNDVWRMFKQMLRKRGITLSAVKLCIININFEMLRPYKVHRKHFNENYPASFSGHTVYF